ncbi:MAG: tol-pal system protein YbgF [Alphaproteobacteria bacterium]
MRRSSIILGAFFLIGAALPFTAATAQDSSKGEASASASANGGSDADKRLQRIEEQLVDLSAQLGTVETMAQSNGGASGGQSVDDGGVGGADSGRLAQLEVEVRALSAKVNEILQRMQQLDGRASANVSTSAPPPPPGASSQPGMAPSSGSSNSSGGFGSTDMEPAHPTAQSASQARAKPHKKKKSGGLFFGLFGDDSDDEESDNPEGLSPRGDAPQSARPMNNSRMSSSGSMSTGGRSGGSLQMQGSRQVHASLSPGEAKKVYDSAFMALQQGNPRRAAEGFEKFIQSNPNDPMAGSAHFWLGEAAFTNGEYRKAADSYLKTATDFPQSEKAPESLLKLGVALKRLNETDAACSTFNELARRFPDAKRLLNRAEREKRRANCS